MIQHNIPVIAKFQFSTKQAILRLVVQCDCLDTGDGDRGSLELLFAPAELEKK